MSDRAIRACAIVCAVLGVGLVALMVAVGYPWSNGTGIGCSLLFVGCLLFRASRA